MNIQMSIKGLGKANRLFTKLPKEISEGLGNTTEHFMEDVKRTAKKMAPVDTGWLRKSIKNIPSKKSGNSKVWKVVAEADYAYFQEYGFKPHFAPILNSSKMAPGVYFVRKHKSFMIPALERQIGRYIASFQPTIKQSIMRASI